MIIQLANVIGGFALSGSTLGSIEAFKSPVAKAEQALGPYKRTLGLVVFVLGVVQLLDRFGLMYVYFLTGGFPQALVAIAAGILLAGSALDKVPGMRELRDALHPYSGAIGLAGMLIGLYAFI